ncbi:MAG: M28 family peptidase [Bacteroidetes bacterium]|nr:M28 family peptidase [Bacteroidota bacterium]
MYKIFFFFSSVIFLSASAQDSAYTSNVLEKLTSKEFAGRGYVDSGHVKAANFIAGEFEKANLEKFNESWFQKFKLSPTVFPSEMEVRIDKKTLQPGVDYIVDANSASIVGSYKLVWLTKKIVGDKSALAKFASGNYSKCFIVVDAQGIDDKEQKEFMQQMIFNPFKAKGIVVIKDSKLTWTISQKQFEYAALEISQDKIQAKAKKITLNIKAERLLKMESQNVVGFIRGLEQPDSFIVISAHYDHLGKMGANTYFPGANDNASGTSMLLNFVKYFSENRPKCSIAFIAFSGEEIGLLGSSYYVIHPLFPLKQIKIQINVDIIGDAGDGITVVNGKPFEKEFNLLVKINDEKKFLPNIQKRGEAANSDHYPFYNKGVKAIFIYSRGKSTAYHDVNDNFKNLPLVNYKGCFHLIRDFILLEQ